MIQVNLNDFELHREKLNKYALHLLSNKGYGGHIKSELKEVSKDIVQNAYIRFQSSSLDVFVTTAHFENFLRLCVYRSYQDELDYRCKNANWLLFINRFDREDPTKMPVDPKPSALQFDIIERFKEQLNENQRLIVQMLLDGYSQAEIAKSKNVSRQAISDSISYIRKIYESKNN